ncbi:MAG: hypothetical protein A2172_01880 [Candidatus Woykebacteria bacterium RBG_13_40_15]|uniref:Type 4 fimbrial biogenesis protein PilX N-terminal domain-containing protein n=1 Tax=Candidatus Woykebacteria bacterium RBG_13_40_15 TaxID=1802593 RepID=A0A1G1W5B4_9BACT|nr:MAG: hypothetical protein A2172_01880 [Candidatus Woykebacteria bacterium RBG_13_40_15]
MLTKLKDIKKQKGQVAITMVLALLSTTTILVVAIGFLTFNEIKKLNNIVKSTQSYYVAEAGIEDAILRVKNSMNYTSSYSLTAGEGSTLVEIAGPLDDLTIISKGNVYNRIRKVAVNIQAEPSTENVDFNYGVQVGEGGLIMKSNSNVLGNIYSNGPISGASNSFVKGDAYSTVTGGATGIDKMTIEKSSPTAIDGNAHANKITASTIENVAFCQTSSKIYDKLGNPISCNTSEPDPTPEPLPITDAQINSMKSWAEAGGETGPVTIPGGGTRSLGPIKINGDLTINSNGTLIVTGTIWVTGNINIASNSLVLLSPSYGANSSGTVVADGQIVINSNVTICGSNGGTLGSCNPENGSYLMLLSTSSKTGDTDPAVEAFSNILTSILYASAGAIKLNSNVHVKEVTGYMLRLESNATVTYETGLASVIFSSGPGGSFQINSWQEIE